MFASADERFMQLALEEARKAYAAGEVPVGAVVTLDERVIAVGGNSPISLKDPTGHAEIIALRRAAQELGAYRIPGVDIYVTLEPCMMCFGAMLHARVRRVVFGAEDPKVGFSRLYPEIADSVRFNHTLEVESGLMADECSALLRSFFSERR